MSFASPSSDHGTAGPSSERPPASLVVVGVGLRGNCQITDEAHRHLIDADRIFAILDANSLIEGLGLESRGVRVERIGMVRWWEGLQLEQWVDRVLTATQSGGKTVLILHGHPGVCVPPTHILVREARDRGLEAKMLPGVSAFDCLCADVGVDLVSEGCMMFDATDFLNRNPRVDGSVHLVLWQVGLIGDPVQSAGSVNQSGLNGLVQTLRRTYPDQHEVTVYEATRDTPTICTVPLQGLPSVNVTERSTLLVPSVRSTGSTGERWIKMDLSSEE